MGNFIAEGMEKFRREYQERCIEGRRYSYKRLGGYINKTLGALIKADKEELAIIHNTSEGINFISHGLSFQEGDQVLLLRDEYPSNVYPWLHLQQKGVTIDYLEAHVDPEEFVKGLRAKINKNTRLVSISGVHWISGAIFPLKEVGQICKENDIFFCVDGTQAVGHVDVDVIDMSIDAMAFSAWKWLLGPLGLGVLYINKRRLPEVSTKFIGTSSVVDDESYLPYKSQLKPTAERFTYSTPSIHDWTHFYLSLKFLNQLGFSNVQARITELSRQTRQLLASQGLNFALSQELSQHTGIVSASHPKVPSASLVKELKASGFITALRNQHIRLAPHICNTHSQLTSLQLHIEKHSQS